MAVSKLADFGHEELQEARAAAEALVGRFAMLSVQDLESNRLSTRVSDTTLRHVVSLRELGGRTRKAYLDPASG
jgi:hypothetical protein